MSSSFASIWCCPSYSFLLLIWWINPFTMLWDILWFFYNQRNRQLLVKKPFLDSLENHHFIAIFSIIVTQKRRQYILSTYYESGTRLSNMISQHLGNALPFSSMMPYCEKRLWRVLGIRNWLIHLSGYPICSSSSQGFFEFRQCLWLIRQPFKGEGL